MRAAADGCEPSSTPGWLRATPDHNSSSRFGLLIHVNKSSAPASLSRSGQNQIVQLDKGPGGSGNLRRTVLLQNSRASQPPLPRRASMRTMNQSRLRRRQKKSPPVGGYWAGHLHRASDGSGGAQCNRNLELSIYILSPRCLIQINSAENPFFGGRSLVLISQRPDPYSSTWYPSSADHPADVA